MESLGLITDTYLQQGSDELRGWMRSDDRGLILEILFGRNFKPENVDALVSMKAAREEKLLKELRSLMGGES